MVPKYDLTGTFVCPLKPFSSLPLLLPSPLGGLLNFSRSPLTLQSEHIGAAARQRTRKTHLRRVAELSSGIKISSLPAIANEICKPSSGTNAR